MLSRIKRLTIVFMVIFCAASMLGATVRIAAPAELKSDIEIEAVMHGIVLRTLESTSKLADVELTKAEESAVKPMGAEAVIEISAYEAELIAKTIYGEGRGCSQMEQAAIAWCILNRADTYGASVAEVVTAPYQFLGYAEHNPVTPEIYALAQDVLTRHAREQLGEAEVGRVLPKGYLWFSGDMVHNYFRNAYSGGTTWNWSLPNPYIA